MNQNRFTFVGADADHMSFRVDLAETPNYRLLQCLLYDLYAQRRLVPQYLFVSEHDIFALTHEIRNDKELTLYKPMSLVAEQFGMESFGIVKRLTSYATGNAVCIVPLPGLENGSVIVGFFR